MFIINNQALCINYSQMSVKMQSILIVLAQNIAMIVTLFLWLLQIVH